MDTLEFEWDDKKRKSIYGFMELIFLLPHTFVYCIIKIPKVADLIP